MQTKPRTLFSTLFLGAALAVSTTACGGGGDGGDGDGDITGDGDGDAADAPVGLDDVVDLGDLIQQENEATSAAAQVGDPAELLGVAQDAGERIRAHVAGVLDRIDEITDDSPDETGVTPGGRPYSIWEGTTADGIEWRFTAIRINERRVRYYLDGKLVDSTERKGVLTGVFVRDPSWEPRKGGGRFHLNLSNLTDLGRGANLDGSIHFVFANKDAERRGRRIFYRNVRERGSMDIPANYAADLIRHVGVGGRFRAVYLDEILPLPLGRELYAMRVSWLAGQGGRGAAAIASYNAGDPVLLGVAHECWDSDGLRTFYNDTYEGNDDQNPNEGVEATDCLQILEQLEAPEAAADGEDLDEEVTEVLDEAGANDITEDDASEVGNVQ